MESPFEVLDVEKDADDGAIEAAYKRRVKEAHPDQGGTREEFQRVRAAYEQLTSEGEVDPADVSEEPPAEPAAEPVDERPRVEYLNYEVLDDHGWDIGDDDLFEKAAAADLDGADYGEFRYDGEDEGSLLSGAEGCGFTWPFACRGGACANCAVAVTEGDLSMPVNHVLPDDVLDQGIRLSCVGEPLTDHVRVIYNVKHLPYLEELRLPPRPFEQAYND